MSVFRGKYSEFFETPHVGRFKKSLRSQTSRVAMTCIEWRLGAEAAEADFVDEGVVGGGVHVGVLRFEGEAQGVAAGGEVGAQGVGPAPVVPVAGAAVGHDDGADA